MILSLKLKIMGIISFMALIGLIISGVSFLGLQKVISSYSRVSDVALPNLSLINDMYLEFREVRINLRSLAIPHISESQANNFILKVQESIKKYEEADKAYRAMPSHQGEENLYKQLSESWASFKEIGRRILAAHKENTNESRNELVAILLKDCPEAA